MKHESFSIEQSSFGDFKLRTLDMKEKEMAIEGDESLKADSSDEKETLRQKVTKARK